VARRGSSAQEVFVVTHLAREQLEHLLVQLLGPSP
jgi:hypothetical protein